MPRDHRSIDHNRQLFLGSEGNRETLGARESVTEPASSWSSSWALSSSRFLALNLTLLALTIGALAATAFSASYLLSGVRAYVGGEGLWSKGEKDAAFHLTSYLVSHREEDYRDALTALAAPLGDHRARLALDRSRIDRAEITAGFRAGRNDRDDTEALTWLYLHCRRVEAFDRAVRLWQLGDGYILRLRDLAQQIHDESAGRGISPQRQEALRREIGDINRAVTVLEDDFSFTLGNLARRVHRLVVFLVLVTAGLLFAGACFVSLGYARRLRQEEAQLASSERRYRTLVETSNDLIWSVDADGRWTFVNQVAQRIYDQQPGEMLGHRFTDFQTPAQAAKDWKQLASIVGGQPGARFETVHLRRDGTPVHLSINAVALFDGNGNVIGATGTAADISDRKRAESVIEFQAYHDSLTGLPNRTLFLERLKQALAVAQRREAELAIFFIDLDRFKLVNDTLGHLAGDRLLQRVAERLRMALRQDDVVARLGGDEFVVLLQSHSRVEGAVKVAQKLLDRLSEPFDVEGHSLQVTTSIGISVFPTDGTDAETLLGSADLALYLAKEQGRNGYQLCTSAMKERAQHRLALEGELHRALERQEFEVYYQPVVSLRDGRIGSLEALVRWRHPLEGLIPPAQFIPLAEELRLVIPIGDWVLRTACRQVNLWHARGLPSLRVAINLSPCHFEQDDAARSLIKTLRESDFDPASTEIEITESAALRDIPRTVAVLERLRGLGVRISMDDFGAGQTSLANLRRFPLDTLKIDRDLTSSIGKVEGGEAIFSAVVSMAHGLQLRAVAEGVETERQLRFLRDCGCDAYQGFLHSRPMPAEAVEEMLLHQSTAIAV